MPALESRASAAGTSMTAPATPPATPPSLAYGRQTPPARRLYAVISTLPGADHARPALASAMATREADISALLPALIDGGLIERRQAGRYAPSPAAAGFRPPQPEPRAIHRWYDWCLATVTAGAELLYPQALRLDPPPGRAAVPAPAIPAPSVAAAWFDAEIGNLAAAVTEAAHHGLPRYAWLLADGLRGWSWQVPRSVDWIAVALAARDAARVAGDGPANAAAYLCLGDAAILAGDLGRAADACTEAERAAARSGWLSGRAAALGNRGGIHRRAGRLADALGDYAAAQELFAAAGRSGHRAAVYNHMGSIYLQLGAANRSVELHRRALAVHRQSGSIAGEARSLVMLADAFRATGRRAAAEQGLVTALAACAQLGDRASESVVRAALADLRSDMDLAA